MIYRPNRGSMWDPSVLWHNGAYHAFMMYNRDGTIGLEAGHCLLAVSPDGVRWGEETVVIEERERERGCHFFKCFVGKCGGRFIMDHGVRRPERQDMLRFYESTDLKSWTYLSSSRPDPRWYGLPPEDHRWDHMYVLPKQEAQPGEGFWGYPVAVAKRGQPRGVGMMQSLDGRSWEALPPARVDWGDASPADFEWGGCERLAGRYYLIGGGVYRGYTGYGMFSFVADDPRGPFQPDLGAYRLCGNSNSHVTWLAAWCRGNGELLISNYASPDPESRAPWMLPLRKPRVGSDGHLRLGWWQGNEALKGKALPLLRTRISVGGAGGRYNHVVLDQSFRPRKGIALEGTICARLVQGPPPSSRACAGLLLDEGRGQLMAILLDVGKKGVADRETRVGRLQEGPGNEELDVMDSTDGGCATVRGLDEGCDHTFRLLTRVGLFELYVDDLLVQTFYCSPDSTRVGFVAKDAEVVLGDLRLYEMSIQEAPAG